MEVPSLFSWVIPGSLEGKESKPVDGTVLCRTCLLLMNQSPCLRHYWLICTSEANTQGWCVSSPSESFAASSGSCSQGQDGVKVVEEMVLYVMPFPAVWKPVHERENLLSTEGLAFSRAATSLPLPNPDTQEHCI